MKRRLLDSNVASLLRARLLADARTRSGGYGTHPLERFTRQHDSAERLADSLRDCGSNPLADPDQDCVE